MRGATVNAMEAEYEAVKYESRGKLVARVWELEVEIVKEFSELEGIL
ncbi:MAG: hypothetical protein SFV15_20350 [Polyangiaceae bacterium]|nr:hypothetical protein [Polyangiaceae bacterium]